MKDRYGREIDYLRVSITDRCNLRCRYCMPDGIEQVPMSSILTFEEIVRICRVSTELGIRKIKVTGGDPLVRKGCPDLIRMLKEIPGIEQVTMTTNGILLGDMMEELLSAGLRDVNVSLDTLNRERFKQISGFDELERVLDSIQKACTAGLIIKLNTVLQSGINDDEYIPIVRYALDKGIDCRFIELMPVGAGRTRSGIPNENLITELIKEYPGTVPDSEPHGNGPAIYYRIPGAKSSVGFISPVHGMFCDRCNRIRLTAKGLLKPCLGHDIAVDLKPLMNGDDASIREAIRQAIFDKPAHHSFSDEMCETVNTGMNEIGG